jgi:hypothetical protein
MSATDRDMAGIATLDYLQTHRVLSPPRLVGYLAPGCGMFLAAIRVLGTAQPESPRFRLSA